MQAIDKRLIKGLLILAVVFIFIYVLVRVVLNKALSESIANPTSSQLVVESSITTVQGLVQTYLLPLYLLLAAILILKWGVKRLMQKEKQQ